MEVIGNWYVVREMLAGSLKGPWWSKRTEPGHQGRLMVVAEGELGARAPVTASICY